MTRFSLSKHKAVCFFSLVEPNGWTHTVSWFQVSTEVWKSNSKTAAVKCRECVPPSEMVIYPSKMVTWLSFLIIWMFFQHLRDLSRVKAAEQHQTSTCLSEEQAESSKEAFGWNMFRPFIFGIKKSKWRTDSCFYTSNRAKTESRPDSSDSKDVQNLGAEEAFCLRSIQKKAFLCYEETIKTSVWWNFLVPAPNKMFKVTQIIVVIFFFLIFWFSSQLYPLTLA